MAPLVKWFQSLVSEDKGQVQILLVVSIAVESDRIKPAVQEFLIRQVQV